MTFSAANISVTLGLKDLLVFKDNKHLKFDISSGFVLLEVCETRNIIPLDFQ